MNTGPGDLPDWVLRELAAGSQPEVSACLVTVRWERSDTPGIEAYIFYVNGEKYAVGRIV